MTDRHHEDVGPDPYYGDFDSGSDVEGDCRTCGGTGEVACGACGGDGCSRCLDGCWACPECGGLGYEPADEHDWMDEG